MYELRPRDMRRRYRRAVIGLGRKNGKSLLGSTCALHGLVEGGLGQEVYSAAGDKEQAKVVFSEAKWQVEQSRSLSRILKTYKDAIEYPKYYSVYRVLAADGDLRQGLNPSLVIFDELHVQKTPDLWEALTLGSGARIDPLVIAITTAGIDLDSVCGELYEYGREIALGNEHDDTFGFWWWEAPEGCSIHDRNAWRAANPNMAEGLLDEEDMESASRHREVAFRRFRLNQWVRARDAWVTSEQWKKGEEPSIGLDWKKPFVAAVDMAWKRDTAAIVVAQAYGRIALDDSPHDEYPQAGDEVVDPLSEEGLGEYGVGSGGLLRTIERVVVRALIFRPVDGVPLDVQAIERRLRRLHATGMLQETLYDPAYFGRSAQILEDDGLQMVEFSQSAARMVPACGDTYELVIAGKVLHDGDPKFTDQVLSAEVRTIGEGWRLSKGRSKRKIDAAIALVMSVYSAIRVTEDPDISGQVW